MANMPQQPIANLQTLVATMQNLVIAMQTMNQTLAKILPQITGSSTSATAGSNGDVPAQVSGYLDVLVSNEPKKIPYYNP